MFPPLCLNPVQVSRWPSNFAPRVKTKFKDFSWEIYIKKIHRGQLVFHREAKQKLFLNMQRFHRTHCYFCRNPKRKGSISPSNFDGQLPNVLFTCLCICVRMLSVVSVATIGCGYEGMQIGWFATMAIQQFSESER